jgi:signal transduction histidine kinase
MINDIGGLVVILTILANLFIAFIVFRTNRKSASNILLSLLALDLMLWTFCNYLALQPGDEVTRLFWVRTVMFVTTPFGPLIFLLASVYPNSEFTLNKKVFYFLLTISVIVFAFAYTPFIFSSLSNTVDGGFSLSPGFAIILYGINLIGFLTWGFVRLIKKYRRSEGVVKKQLGLFLFGTVASFTLMTLTNFVAVVVFGSIKLTFLGPPFTLIMIGFMAYAIVKHGLFNLKVFATQALIVIMWLILFSKLVVSSSVAEFSVDAFIFIAVVVFGILLIRSVKLEIYQKDQLTLLNEKLKELDKRKDEFLNMASHELRAPMTAIKGYVSMLIEGDAGEIPEKARGFLTDAQGVTDRLIRLVNNMLNVSRIEENRMVFQIDTISLSEVARTVFSEFQGEAVRKGLQFDLLIPTEVKDRVTVDPDRIHEVIANFISNAIKYTEKGSIQVKLSQPDTSRIRCEIIDTGPGISPEEQVKLFQKFARAESAIGKTVGTGLGLYISKLLVSKFNGTTGLISATGKGSTFWFELPLAQ